jgi:hypothetical protein
MLKCRRCKLGEVKVVSDVIGNRAIVHCQNPSCAVLYERRFSKSYQASGPEKSTARSGKRRGDGIAVITPQERSRR